MAGLSRFVPEALRPLAKGAQRFVRSLNPVELNAALLPKDCRGELQAKRYVLLLEQGEAVASPIRITNHGQAIWSSQGKCPVRLVFRWLSNRREPLSIPPILVNFDVPIYPGETVDIPVTITGPDFNGHALIEVALEQEGGTHLRDHGIRPLLLDVQVSGKMVEDIDYHKAYATANLAVDYWTVVGPKTKEEFHQLAEAKMVHLREVGLTPDSRILDVGCGTGQLAFPLENYLSDQGAFTGTDIGIEAIPFCQERFKRPNFKFLQNEMTKIPLTGETYDIICYFSVFTHTFPDETALLLAESKRLLAPGGSIIGDVFTSSIVERCAGNRGKMELNAEHFLRLVDLVGLKATLMHDWPQNEYLRRQVYRYQHKGEPAT
jgi:ubiquinone/menaquinone biosynthesis C-methylase UbiE